MTIKPVSDLRNYNTILQDCQADSPVFLTKNGRGRYVLMDVAQYENMTAQIKLMAKIVNAERRVENGEQYMNLDELRAKLGVN